jgi:hypothetical protein
MNELVSPLEGHVDASEAIERRSPRGLAIEAIGPLTMLGGIVWAIAQPYRIVFLRDEEKSLWDYLGQGPLLVLLVGLLFTAFLAPGLIEDLRRADHEDAATR